MSTRRLQNLLHIVVLLSLLGTLSTGCVAPSAQPTAAQPAATPTTRATPTGASSPIPTIYTLPLLEEAAAPPVAEILAGLENLSLTDFFAESYRQLLLRSPQTLTELGLSASFGQRDDHLDDLSDAFIHETQALEAGILQLLQTYDRDQLSPEEQISYDVYVWYLENQVRGHAYMYLDYPLHHFLGSWQFNLQALFTEKHPLQSLQNAEDYVYRLQQVERQAQQLLAGLEIRTRLGVIPPRNILELTQESLRADLQVDAASPDDVHPEELAVYSHFLEGVRAIQGLSDAERQALEQAALQATETSLVPAYRSLLDYLDQLIPLAGDTAGLGRYPDGEAYYAYLLQRETSTSLSPAEAHEMGLQEVTRLQAELRDAFAQLGYPEDQPLGALIGRAVQADGFYDTTTPAGQQALIDAYQDILTGARAHLDEVFAEGPSPDLIVKSVPAGGGGFYEPGSLDGSRPGVFYVGVGAAAIPKYNMATIAYHEAIPGHHFQISIAQAAHLPLFRNVLFFNGYGEGWAVYSEHLAWEMGLYADDPLGNIGRLQLELLRAARLVTDTGIHAKGWSRREAITYLQTTMGDTSGQWASEVDRYIARPGQASGYWLGRLEIMRLRQLATDAQGEAFDIREFHSWVLDNGSLPLDILARIVSEN